jgi:hypothetical protein
MKARLIFLFLQLNYKTLIGLALGGIAGYFYWERYGLQWGSYPLSSECLANCLLGGLFGGFIASLISELWAKSDT